jgi:hypothetical protein
MSEEPEKYQAADANRSMKSAIQFEESLRQCIDYYMQEGLTVSNAVGTLALLQQEVSLAFCVSNGVIDDQIKRAVFKDMKKI